MDALGGRPAGGRVRNPRRGYPLPTQRCSRQTVNAIETERYDPSLPLALKIGRLFKLPVETIFEE